MVRVEVIFIATLRRKHDDKTFNWLSAHNQSYLFQQYNQMLNKHLFDLLIEKRITTIEDIYPL